MTRRYPALAVVALLGASMILAGCDRTPTEYRGIRDRLSENIETAREELRASQNSSVTRTKSDPQFAELASIAGFEKDFKGAEQLVNSADEQFKKGFGEAMKLAEPARGDAVDKIAANVSRLLDDAADIRRRPVRLVQTLRTLIADRTTAERSASTNAATLSEKVNGIATALVGSKQRHPAKATDLDRRYNELKDQVASASSKATELPKESRLPRAAVLLDDCEQLITDSTEDLTDLTGRMSQLDRSYSKVLTDMRADMTMTIGRESWVESSESSSTRSYTYAPKVLTALQAQKILENPSRIDPNALFEAGFDPRENMGSDDTAEYWVDEVETDLFHKYSIIDDKGITESNWVEVDSVKFERHMDDLGMTILTKEKGQYEEDADIFAAPPGWNFVGNPQYGTWAEGSNGRYWSWGAPYGYYGGFYPGFFIWFDDWDDWYKYGRRKRSWYSRQGRDPLFGTGSPYSSRVYGGSTWVSSGGYRRQSPGLRGLARYWRGGGPGGGGK